MAIVRDVKRHFRINGDVPPDYALRPVKTAGVLYAQSTATDLTGRPVGARGWGEITLNFDRISARGLAWWNALFTAFDESAVVDRLVLPDTRYGRVLEGYPFHNKFARGVLWRPVVDPSADLKRYRGEDGWELWIEGTVTIRITELGRSAV